MSNGAQPFIAGEPVIWRCKLSEDSPTEIRQVLFRDMVNRDEATIAWGLRSDGSGEPHLYKVALSELSRPVARPPIFAPPPRPEPVGPPVAPADLGERRAALRDALANKATMQTAADAATALVTRAETSRDAARRVLSEVNAKQAIRTSELEAAIRQGRSANNGDDAGTEIGITREHAQRDVDAAETVCERFHTELRQARERLSDADSRVKSAANTVLVGILHCKAAELAAAERRAATLRAELKAVGDHLVADHKMSLPNSVATLLGNPPKQIEDPVGWEFRQRLFGERTLRWRALLCRLVAGDADADLVSDQTETAASSEESSPRRHPRVPHRAARGGGNSGRAA